MADQKVGTGAVAEAGDQVTVSYVGMLTDGTVFDASANHAPGSFTFTLGAGQVIKGWDEGVVGMKVGGERELVIPASLGYGAQAVGPIPANSTLVFQVQLLNVQTPAK
jgi:FKBP-type peptidyl-prolyl cis-trans isomerase